MFLCTRNNLSKLFHDKSKLYAITSNGGGELREKAKGVFFLQIVSFQENGLRVVNAALEVFPEGGVKRVILFFS
ncbi:MAG: hypothetical protein ABGX37_03315 [Methylococcales bacterium]